MMDGMGTYLVVYERDGEVFVEAGHEGSIDAAVTLYMAEGRDGLLHLTLLSGDAHTTRVSEVRNWTLSTPVGRARDIELAQAADEETVAIKQSLGVWDDGE